MRDQILKKIRKVLLIDGASRQVLPLIKGFHNLGCEVTVFCSSKLDVGYVSKYADRKVLGYINYDDEEGTYKSILKVAADGKYDLVVPMMDFFATILSKNKEELCQYIPCVYAEDWSKFSIAIDKQKTMELCMKNGIPCPKTAEIETIQTFDDSDWKYPLVVKPKNSFGARGFSVVSSRAQLIEVYEETKKIYGNALVQEYIPQTDKQYQVELVMSKTHECILFILMDKIRWYPLNGGSSTMNVTMHDEEIMKSSIELMNAIGWTGYASLDLIRDPRDGIAKIMEINPRINGTAKLNYACGLDLAQYICDSFGGVEKSELANYADGIGIRLFQKDVLWLIKSRGKIKTNPSWFSFRNTADEIWDKSDIKPFVVYTITSLKKLIHLD